MGLKEDLQEYAKYIGIDDIKITSADSFPELKSFLVDMKEKKYLSKFVNDDLDLITTPRRVLSDAKSIIVCAISYSVNDKYIDESRKKVKVDLRGSLSSFAWGQDYHVVLEKKLDKLIVFIESKIKEAKMVKFVDTGPTVDRALAKRAGIGWRGKNCSIINPEYGSWIFLGGLITDLEITVDEPIENRCGDCRKCIDACPTGAIVKPYQLDSRKCLGYLTLSKGYIKEEYRKKMGIRIWGCDTCQVVCPHNGKAKIGDHKEFRPGSIESFPELIPLLLLTNREYKDKFMQTPMNWRGKRPIQRNAAIVLGNLKDKRAVPPLLNALKDSKAIVRAHVAWALGEIKEKSALNGLEGTLSREKDGIVRRELLNAIRNIQE